MKARQTRLRTRAMIVIRDGGWGGVYYHRKRAAWRATAADLCATANCTESQEFQRQSRQDAANYDEAYMRACELDSPNSPDFDALHERIFESM